jgi:hypothetical protein
VRFPSRRGSVTPSATSFTNFLFETEASQPNVGVGLRLTLPGGNTGTKPATCSSSARRGLPTCDTAALIG